jgi:hypothetical protein
MSFLFRGDQRLGLLSTVVPATTFSPVRTETVRLRATMVFEYPVCILLLPFAAGLTASG